MKVRIGTIEVGDDEARALYRRLHGGKRDKAASRKECAAHAFTAITNAFGGVAQTTELLPPPAARGVPPPAATAMSGMDHARALGAEKRAGTYRGTYLDAPEPAGPLGIMVPPCHAEFIVAVSGGVDAALLALREGRAIDGRMELERIAGYCGVKPDAAFLGATVASWPPPPEGP